MVEVAVGPANDKSNQDHPANCRLKKTSEREMACRYISNRKKVFEHVTYAILRVIE